MNPLVKSRGKTHGPYRTNMAGSAIIGKSFKQLAELDLGRKTNEEEIGALQLAANKMARIIIGDHEFNDHWEDLKNYIRFYREFSKTPKTSKNPERNIPENSPAIPPETPPPNSEDYSSHGDWLIANKANKESQNLATPPGTKLRKENLPWL